MEDFVRSDPGRRDVNRGGRSLLELRVTWIALLIWVGLIWTLSSLPVVPSAGSDSRDFLMRQGAHLGLHAVLAVLAWRAASLSWGTPTGFAFAICLAIPHAVLDELYQALLPGRDANLEDVVYNLVGVLIALVLIRYRRPAGSWLRSTRSLLFSALGHDERPST